MIAEGLNSPYISIASKLDVNGNMLTLEREITGGVEVVEVSLPVVVSCAKGMAEQRIPNMRGIMAARTKPLQVLAPTVNEALTSYVTFASPQAKSSVKLIDPNNMDELVSLLHNEAKVI
jgi:electron transfer flavoprotein beta subunit